MFVTVWLGILTISTGQLVSACAGHEYPVFYRRESGFRMEKDPHGPALGAMEGIRFREKHWQMNPGDLLFLYTDGVPEATDASMELFGNERMLRALAESPALKALAPKALARKEMTLKAPEPESKILMIGARKAILHL